MVFRSSIHSQFSARISLLRSVEGNADEILPKDVGEHRLPQRAVFVENLIHDVPRVALAGEVAGNLSDVVFDDLGQLRRICDRGHPVRKLAVPDERVAAAGVSVRRQDDSCVAFPTHRRTLPFSAAKLAKASAPSNVKTPRDASVASHLKEFSAVNCPKSALRISADSVASVFESPMFPK